MLAENEKLKAQLRDTDLELTDVKLQLEKATQVYYVGTVSVESYSIVSLGCSPNRSSVVIAEAGTIC